jgi:hypothetical protein
MIHEKSFICDYNEDNNTFSQLPYLKTHFDRHLGFKKYKFNYNECNKSCFKSSHSKRHISRKHQ